MHNDMSHVRSLRSSERSSDTGLLHMDSVIVIKKRYLYVDKNSGGLLVQLISSKITPTFYASVTP